jgi:uncharacterized membrane protein (DUF4010 family)
LANRASDFFSAAGLIVTALSLAVVNSPDVRLAVDTAAAGAGAAADAGACDGIDWSFSDTNRASDFFSAAGLIVTALSLAVVNSPDVRLAVDTAAAGAGAAADAGACDGIDWSFSDANRASDFFSAAGLIVTALSLAVVNSPDVRLAVDAPGTNTDADTGACTGIDWSFSDANRASDFFSAAGLIVTALSLAVVNSPDVRLPVDAAAAPGADDDVAARACVCKGTADDSDDDTDCEMESDVVFAQTRLLSESVQPDFITDVL